MLSRFMSDDRILPVNSLLAGNCAPMLGHKTLVGETTECDNAGSADGGGCKRALEIYNPKVLLSAGAATRLNVFDPGGGRASRSGVFVWQVKEQCRCRPDPDLRFCRALKLASWFVGRLG